MNPKVLEFIIVTTSVIGSYLIAEVNITLQTLGFVLFFIANVAGIWLFITKKMGMMVLQNIIFLILTSKALWLRM